MFSFLVQEYIKDQLFRNGAKCQYQSLCNLVMQMLKTCFRNFVTTYQRTHIVSSLGQGESEIGLGKQNRGPQSVSVLVLYWRGRQNCTLSIGLISGETILKNFFLKTIILSFGKLNTFFNMCVSTVVSNLQQAAIRARLPHYDHILVFILFRPKLVLSHYAFLLRNIVVTVNK